MKHRRAPRRAAGRLARLLFVLLWLVLIVTPCMALVLASQGEFRLRTGPAPEEEFRLWLVQDAQRAGLAISYASQRDVDGGTCYQTEARFLLWRGQHLDEETATAFCSCYDEQDEAFSQQRVTVGACPAPGTNADD